MIVRIGKKIKYLHFTYTPRTWSNIDACNYMEIMLSYLILLFLLLLVQVMIKMDCNSNKLTNNSKYM